MKIEVQHGRLSDKPKFQRLMQLYLYDFSEFLPLDLDESGFFKEILDSYFADASKTPFLVIVDGELAGFVLVSEETLLPENTGGKRIKEFGNRAAAEVFARFPGRWEVRVVKSNLPAEKFWDVAIAAFAGSNHTKQLREDELWDGAIFSLTTRAEKPQGS